MRWNSRLRAIAVASQRLGLALALGTQAGADLAETTHEPHMLRLSRTVVDDVLAAPAEDRQSMLVRWATRALPEHPDDGVLTIAPAWKLTASDAASAEQQQRELAGRIVVTQLAITALREAMPNAAVSVYGLPLEERSDAADAWSVVEAQLDAFVTSRSLVLAGSRDDEAQTIRRSAPRAFELSQGRPILFRTNHLWRVIHAGDEAVEEELESEGDAIGEEITLDGDSLSRTWAAERVAGDEAEGGTTTTNTASSSAPAIAAADGSSGGAGAGSAGNGSGSGGSGGSGGAGGDSGGAGQVAGSGGGAVPGPPSRFWTWEQPQGLAEADPRIIGMVRVFTTARTGTTTANVACDMILRRRLRAGEVCVLLQNFGIGQGDLWASPGYCERCSRAIRTLG